MFPPPCFIHIVLPFKMALIRCSITGSRTQRSTNHRQHFASSRLRRAARLLQLASEIETHKTTIPTDMLYTASMQTRKRSCYSSPNHSMKRSTLQVFHHFFGLCLLVFFPCGTFPPSKVPSRQSSTYHPALGTPNSVQIDQALGEVNSFQT